MTWLRSVQWHKLPWAIIVQGVLLIMLASGAFALSFGNLKAYAETMQLKGPSWIYPVVLDFGACAFSVSAFIGALYKREARLARILVWVLLGLSIVFQLHEAYISESLKLVWSSAETYIFAMGHAVAPLMTVLNLEVLVSAMLATHRDHLKKERNKINLEKANENRKRGKVSDSKIASAVANAKSKAEAARDIGVSPATLYRRLRRLST